MSQRNEVKYKYAALLGSKNLRDCTYDFESTRKSSYLFGG